MKRRRWRKPDWMKGLTVSRRAVEHLKITCPRERRQEIYDWADENGWQWQGMNQYTNKTMWPRCDPTRLVIRLAREIEE